MSRFPTVTGELRPHSAALLWSRPVMLLERLVETSRRIAATSRRKEKIELLAALLRTAGPGELEPAVAFLSGTTRHGRIGIGYASLHAARAAAPAATVALTIADIEQT